MWFLASGFGLRYLDCEVDDERDRQRHPRHHPPAPPPHNTLQRFPSSLVSRGLWVVGWFRVRSGSKRSENRTGRRGSDPMARAQGSETGGFMTVACLGLHAPCQGADLRVQKRPHGVLEAGFVCCCRSARDTA
eukprot:3880865-Rhodomonas_salina.1